MRLLNVETLELREFFEAEVPPYGILSHRWGKDEVSYQMFMQGKTKTGASYRKIRGLCKFVRERKIWRFSEGVSLQWVWVDTCCIDKTSSAELSEAINSMYSWYSNAAECYIYMQDVPSLTGHSERQVAEAFDGSEWFKRGWTLQELLAPELKLFCNSKWEILGHIHDLSNVYRRWLKFPPTNKDINSATNWEDIFSADLTSCLGVNWHPDIISGRFSVRAVCKCCMSDELGRCKDNNEG
jgi:hypothetical protein